MNLICKILKAKFLLILLFAVFVKADMFSQLPDYPLDIQFYNFIDYSKNKLIFPGDSSSFTSFFSRFNELIVKGNQKLRILHIGGSHIQADIYTAQVRMRFQTFSQGLEAGRGFIFPYKMAKTNNPSNYKVTYTGNWEFGKIVRRKDKCLWGLSGYNVYTADSLSSMSIKVKNPYRCNYNFDIVKIFHLFGDSIKYNLSIKQDTVNITGKDYPELNYTEFHLPELTDSFCLEIIKTDSVSAKFVLQGISLETSDNIGIYYDAVGVNGASVPSFLKEKLFEKNLQVLKPDMVILSLGTNDAYTTKFVPEIYKANYDTLIQKILSVNPKTAIMITVPNDDYYHKRYPNPNTELQEKVIFELAKKYNAAVWNLYDIMGRLNSSQLWYENNLMKYDRIHFTHNGYILKGNLFFNAFVKFFDSNIKSQDNILINKKL